MIEMRLKRMIAALTTVLAFCGTQAVSAIDIDIDLDVGNYATGARFGPMVVSVSNLRPNENFTVLTPSGTSERFFCANGAFQGCGANITLTFDDPIKSLSFEAEQSSTLENFSILVYSDPLDVIGSDDPDFSRTWDDDGVDLGSGRRGFTLVGDTPFDRIFINNTTDYAAFGNFSYEPAVIPLPLSGLLLLTGVCLLSASRRRPPA